MSDKEKLLIIGTGMGTAQLLRELVGGHEHGDEHEQKGHDAYEVEVIGEEANPCYNRILLSSIFSGEKSEEDLQLIEHSWFRKHDITLYNSERVLEVDVEQRIVRTSKGRESYFDKLVFATGSRPFFPEIPGMDADNVLGFRTQADLDRIRQSAGENTHAVVVGGGLLGLEAASGLAGLGGDVTVVNRGPWLMQRQLDKTAAELLQNNIETQGIEFSLGASPQEFIQKDGKVVAVQLDNGRRLHCSLVLVTAGIVPNAELALQAGIECGRGIIVNKRMQSSIPGIYALGECCEIDSTLFGLVAPVKQQAKILASVLCERTTEAFEHQETPVQLKVAGVNVVSAGNLPFPENSHSQVLVDRAQGVYRRLVFEGERLLGYILIGDQKHSAWYRELLEAGESLADEMNHMMFGSEAA